MDKIDFVIIWVDGNDRNWQEEKAKYEPNRDNDIRDIRYRDWDNLQYLFRGIEKFAPWVNKVHFVTCGHLPKWLNKDCPKLNIVKHSDYIPEKYLPTFSANPIELNLHRIKGLSEQFVFFNDDTFLIKDVKPEDFFKHGKPCESAILNPASPAGKELTEYIYFNDWVIINKNFNKNESIRNNFFKWFNYKNGINILRTICLMPWNNFLGFKFTHLPTSFLKSKFEEVWEKEYESLDLTSSNRFRSKNDLNQYVIKDWQIASGNFYPRKYKIGKFFKVSDGIEDIIKTIEKQKYKMICVNDDEIGDKFEKYKNKINEAFDRILPEKSSFEI